MIVILGAVLGAAGGGILAWRRKGKPADMPIAQAVKDPDVLAEVQTAVDNANKAVSKAESIRKFTILTDDWSVEGGQLTPSMKLKRNVVMAENDEDVEATRIRITIINLLTIIPSFFVIVHIQLDLKLPLTD